MTERPPGCNVLLTNPKYDGAMDFIDDPECWQAVLAQVAEARRRATNELFDEAANTVSPRSRIATTRLPLPQNGSHTTVPPACSGSCTNSGASATGGVHTSGL
jgi:hypothetical protein